MQVSTHQKYGLRIGDDSSYQLIENDVVSKFSYPATVRGISKLYVVSVDKKLLYVGIAKQPMASRLNGGLKANGKNGYHGYKWKGQRQILDFHVFSIQEKGVYIEFNEMEAIEAEVAYLCRLKFGQWPAFQNEIHFQETSTSQRNVAKRIYESVTGRSSSVSIEVE